MKLVALLDSKPGPRAVKSPDTRLTMNSDRITMASASSTEAVSPRHAIFARPGIRVFRFAYGNPLAGGSPRRERYLLSVGVRRPVPAGTVEPRDSPAPRCRPPQAVPSPSKPLPDGRGSVGLSAAGGSKLERTSSRRKLRHSLRRLDWARKGPPASRRRPGPGRRLGTPAVPASHLS